MAPRKRPSEEANPNVETRSAKTRRTSTADRKKEKKKKPSKMDDVQKENLAPAPPDKVQTSASKRGRRRKDASPKRAAPANEPEAESSDEEAHGHDEVPMEDKDPYEYILMERPQYDMEAEEESKPANERRSEEELEREWEKERESVGHDVAAASKPDHKWVIMRGAWIDYANTMREASYRSPDNFNMYIYNDFEGYGILELIENHIQAFATAHGKKEKNLKDMWIPLVGLIQFMENGQMGPFAMLDDGERHANMIQLIGCAYLAMLNALDHAGQLQPDSEFKDLGLVTALYLRIPDTYEDSYDQDEDFDWRQVIEDYVAAKRIDTSLVHGSRHIELSEVPLDTLEGLPKGGVDRWGFKKMLNRYKRNYCPLGRLGGTEFDITKMSRKERASYAFNKKDPLGHIPDRAFKEGVLMFEPV